MGNLNMYGDQANGENEYGYFWGQDLLKYNSFKLPVIENILYERDVVCISSAPGVGKTMLALQLLSNLTSGTPFLGIYETMGKKRVLYIQSEGDRSETLERLELMLPGVPRDDEYWAHINIPGTTLNVTEEFDKFTTWMKQCPMGFDVIIIDPLYTTVKGSMIEDAVATNWVRNVREWKQHFNSSIIVLHHDAKDIYTSEGSTIDRGNNVTFGSVFWQAFFDHTYKLRKKLNVYTLDGGKQRNDKTIDKIDMVLLTKPLMFSCKSEASDESIFTVRREIGKTKEPVTAMELGRLTGIPKASLYRILKRLEDSKQIVKIYTTSHNLYKEAAV